MCKHEQTLAQEIQLRNVMCNTADAREDGYDSVPFIRAKDDNTRTKMGANA